MLLSVDFDLEFVDRPGPERQPIENHLGETVYVAIGVTKPGRIAASLQIRDSGQIDLRRFTSRRSEEPEVDGDRYQQHPQSLISDRTDSPDDEAECEA